MVGGDGKWTRREFLAKSGAAGVGLALGGRGAVAQEEAEPFIGAAGMPLKVLGKTGEKVPILGFGGGGTVAKTPRLLNVAMQQGITFVDTADGYGGGKSETETGNVLAAGGNRDKIFIVTKTGERNPAKLEQRVDGSLERLQTDYVDALYLNDLNDPWRLNSDMRAAAEALKKTKKVRFFGFSSHGGGMLPTLDRAAECGFVDVLMLRYNFRDYDNDALHAALDKCAEAEIGLVAMKTGAGAVPNLGRFATKKTPLPVMALKATWADERISCIVSLMNTTEKIEQNAAAAKDRRMSSAEWGRLERYAEATDHLYCRGCAALCEGACDHPVAIADILRYKMYGEGYGDWDRARQSFAKLPPDARTIAGRGFEAAEAACPHKLRIGDMLQGAVRQLA